MILLEECESYLPQSYLSTYQPVHVINRRGTKRTRAAERQHEEEEEEQDSPARSSKKTKTTTATVSKSPVWEKEMGRKEGIESDDDHTVCFAF